MNSEFKQRWIDALRSGKYEQCREQLRSKGNRYCCLGVICDIYDKSNWEKSEDITLPGYRYTIDNIYSSVELPEELMYIIGLTHDDMAELIELNDHEGYDFDQIADWIEENL